MILALQTSEPLIRWRYIRDQWDGKILDAVIDHIQLTVVSVVLGVILSAIMTALALRYRWSAAPIMAFSAFVYTIPSVALFGILVPYTGLSKTPAVIALTGYTFLILVTAFIAGFRSVPGAVLDAADGMGLSPRRRVLTVELPLALPYISDGHPGGHGHDRGPGHRGVDHRPGRTRRPDPRRPAADLLDADDRRRGAVGGPGARSRPRPVARGARADAVDAPWTRRVTALAAQAGVPRDIGLWEWFSREQTWRGEDGILASLADTVTLCVAVMIVSVLIAVPLAAVLAHHRRGELAATWTLNVGRAIPTFAIAGLLVPISLTQGYGFEPWPIFIALTMLALPPIFLTSYTAVRQVDEGAVDAARAMGFTERDVLVRVELALAVGLILSGIRVAAVAVVATEPLRAFLGGNGLGRYVRDGLGQNNDSLLIGGAILVVALATVTGMAFGALERVALPEGVRRLRQVQNKRTGDAR